MGLFNILNAEVACNQCLHSYTDRIQFKYSATWQYEYALGDELRWEDPRINAGIRRPGEVLVYGMSELDGCPRCGFQNITSYQATHTYFEDSVEYDIIVIDNILHSIRTLQDYNVYLEEDAHGNLGFPV
ncbi:MAG: hypothetical protein M3Y54_06030 [Bacteroidota bacterium]|nr:hypothetical protein [Bacteroidota bacterium]